MNYFDIIVGGLLVFAVVKGFKNGLIIELASLAALVLGVLGAIFLSSWAEAFMRQWWDFKYIGAVAFLATFIGIVIGTHMLAKLINEMIKLAALNLINRLAGALFSFLKYAFILSVLLSVLEFFSWNTAIIPPDQQSSSLLYKPLSKLAPSIFPYLKFEKEIQNILPDADGFKV